MPAAAHARWSLRNWPGRLPHSIGKRLEIVIGRHVWSGLTLYSHHGPAPGNREPIGVRGAQVVRMRLDERRKRAEHRRGLDVGVSERGDGGSTAGRPRAAPGLHR